MKEKFLNEKRRFGVQNGTPRNRIQKKIEIEHLLALLLILFLIFTVIYFVIMGTILAIRARIKRVKRDEAIYHSVYKK